MKHLKPLIITLALTLFCSVTFSQDENCVDFDGSNDHILIGDVNNLGTSDFTIEAWIFVENTSSSNKIINKGCTSVGTPTNAGYALRTNYDGIQEIEFQLAHSDGSFIRLQYPCDIENEWHHIAGIRKGTKIELYLDGVMVNSDVTPVVFNTNTNIPLAIGAIHKAGLQPVNEHMDGKIDEARIWDVARTPYEIEEYRFCAITEPEAGLVAVYNLNEFDGLIAADSSGNGNDGSLEYGPVFTTSTVALNCTVDIPEEINEPNVIFPNPFTDEVTISDNDFTDYFVYDMMGRIVMSGSINDNKINLSKLVKGSYILKVYSDHAVVREQIIKE